MTEDEDRQLASAEKDLAKKGPRYGWIGLGLTVTYAVVIVTIISTRWGTMVTMTPNEWGDFLAGTFGPLALLWVVLGFLQQGSELKNSRDALLLQAEELRHSVEAQKDLGQAAWAQVGEERLNRESVLQERRKAEEGKKLADLPTLLINNGGGGSGSGEKHFSLSIHNQGKTCIKISFSIDDENLKLNRTILNQLNHRASENIKITTSFNYEYSDCIFRVSYQDLTGGNHSQIYQLKAANGNLLVVDTLGVRGADC